MSLARFKGALVGAVIGDCIGAHFEGEFAVKISELQKLCQKIQTGYQEQKGKASLRFTDDTAMARSVMSSLQEHKKFDADDMANRFAEEYCRDSFRGYGGNVITVFSGLLEPGLKDVYQPAREQFDGMGSYGNGGAMRIAPAPLFTFHESDKSALEKLSAQITRLTHTHHLAIKGAILQAFAVDQSLRLASDQPLDCDKFCDDLISIMKSIEVNTNYDVPPPHKKLPPKRKLDEGPTPYCAKLEKIKDFVKEEDLSVKTVESILGNDISALGSVPAAVLSFLRGSMKRIKGLEEANPFKRVILYAILLGGDTDTIATMAGAMAGAFYGIDAIPEDWRYSCEGVEDAEKAAEFFFSQTELFKSESKENVNESNDHNQEST